VVLISDGHGGDEDPRLRDPAVGLSAFRSRLYGCFGRRADALFELTDAVLTTNTNPSLVHLSLASVHRRGWGSLYAALNKGRIGAGMLGNLLARVRLADDGGRARINAVDQSSWPRCDAECSPDRGYYYHPIRHSAGQPIVAGWSCQLVAELGFERDSWVSPADIRRVRPEEDADLELLWRSYCRRFYAQLLLARGVVADRRLAWEKPLAVEKLTPYRVMRTFVTLVALSQHPRAFPALGIRLK
jgi:hypothetical protein